MDTDTQILLSLSMLVPCSSILFSSSAGVSDSNSVGRKSGINVDQQSTIFSAENIAYHCFAPLNSDLDHVHSRQTAEAQVARN